MRKTTSFFSSENQELKIKRNTPILERNYARRQVELDIVYELFVCNNLQIVYYI